MVRTSLSGCSLMQRLVCMTIFPGHVLCHRESLYVCPVQALAIITHSSVSGLVQSHKDTCFLRVCVTPTSHQDVFIAIYK